jgi:hypothetical protein
MPGVRLNSFISAEEVYLECEVATGSRPEALATRRGEYAAALLEAFQYQTCCALRPGNTGNGPGGEDLHQSDLPAQ